MNTKTPKHPRIERFVYARYQILRIYNKQFCYKCYGSRSIQRRNHKVASYHANNIHYQTEVLVLPKKNKNAGFINLPEPESDEGDDVKKNIIEIY